MKKFNLNQWFWLAPALALGLSQLALTADLPALLRTPIARALFTATPEGQVLARRLGVALAENEASWVVALAVPERRAFATDFERRLKSLESRLETLHGDPHAWLLREAAEHFSLVEAELAFARPSFAPELRAPLASPGAGARQAFLRGAGSPVALHPGAPLAGKHFEGAMPAVNLSYARLAQAQFRRVDLSQIPLVHADLTYSVFLESQVPAKHLLGASLNGSKWLRTKITGAPPGISGFKGARVDFLSAQASGWSLGTLDRIEATGHWYTDEGRILGAALNAPYSQQTAREFEEQIRRLVEKREGSIRAWLEALDKNPTHKAYRVLLNGRLEASATAERSRAAVVANQIAADKAVVGWIRAKQPITPERVLQLNEILGRGLSHNGRVPGTLRDGEIYASGDRFLTAVEVPNAFAEFFVWLRAQHGNSPLVTASRAYQKLVSIHPFWDGNGRTSRQVMDWILLEHGYPPATFGERWQAFVAIHPEALMTHGLQRTHSPEDALRSVLDGVERSMGSLRGISYAPKEP